MAKSYEGVILTGSTFPDAKYKAVSVKLNNVIQTEYIPVLATLNLPLGLQCLMIAMTHMEGFDKGTRSYRTNNPGNIGNTDSGANKKSLTLKDGIILQAQFLIDVANGDKKAYPMGKEVFLKPYFSPEISKHPEYGLSPFLPGYKFTYTGQLDQFVKIYSTGARATNNYINVIVSYFAMRGLIITPSSKLIDMIGMTL